jgi:hypothetical protein
MSDDKRFPYLRAQREGMILGHDLCRFIDGRRLAEQSDPCKLGVACRPVQVYPNSSFG